MSYFIALDIGCIECGENSNVLGIFTGEKKAQAVCDEHEDRQEGAWHGEHHFFVIEIDEKDQEYRIEYDGSFDVRTEK